MPISTRDEMSGQVRYVISEIKKFEDVRNIGDYLKTRTRRAGRGTGWPGCRANDAYGAEVDMITRTRSNAPSSRGRNAPGGTLDNDQHIVSLSGHGV